MTSQVTVQATEVNKQTSTFTPVSKRPAGDASTVLTLMLLDENNQPVDMDVKDISLNSSVRRSTISAPDTKICRSLCGYSNSRKDAENVTLTPVVNGTTLSSARYPLRRVTP
ncbi:hypothetical protein KCP78_18870 [Salmonella enterica subsp. enterica]|nr:hypothetical protein KCP78_18870 [Salmonella enterica subsp. enterica]